MIYTTMMDNFYEWIMREMAMNFSNKFNPGEESPIQDMRSWLGKNDKNVLAYHATPTCNFWSILKDGIKSGGTTRRRFSISNPNRTYFALDYRAVERYARYDDEIIFVVEVPGKLLRGNDLNWSNAFTATMVVPPQNIVGVIYPPHLKSNYHPIREFVNLVREGKFGDEFSSESCLNTDFRQATSDDDENYAMKYIADLAKKSRAIYAIFDNSKQKRTNDYIDPGFYHEMLNVLPSYRKFKNWTNKDLVRFFQGAANRHVAYLNKWNEKNGMEPEPPRIIPPNILDGFPDMPIYKAVEKMKTIKQN